jgi:hypothetical protein
VAKTDVTWAPEVSLRTSYGRQINTGGTRTTENVANIGAWLALPFLRTPLIFVNPHLAPIRADSLPDAGVFLHEWAVWRWKRRGCAMADG